MLDTLTYKIIYSIRNSLSFMQASKKPIFLTGAFFPQKEWLSELFSSIPELRFLPDLFAPDTENSKIFGFEHHYPFIAPQENNPYALFITEFLGYNLNEEQVKGAFGKSFRQLYQRFVDKYQFTKEQKKEVRPFIYDTHGFFLTEWLYTHYQADVIVLIQHPFDFVQNWLKAHPTTDLHTLISSKIQKYCKNIDELLASTYEHEWQKAMQFWLIQAQTIVYYQMHYPNWFFFRYEDLREQPERLFTDICDMLNLTFSKELKQAIEKTLLAREADSDREKPPYLNALIEQTQDLLLHFYPKNMIGRHGFR